MGERGKGWKRLIDCSTADRIAATGMQDRGSTHGEGITSVLVCCMVLLERNDEYACQEKRELTQDSGTKGWRGASDLRTQGSLRLTFARCTRQRKEEKGGNSRRQHRGVLKM